MSLSILNKTETGRRQATRDIILSAEAKLKRSCFPELRLVFCSFSEGVLSLSGTVSSEFLKLLASRLVRGIAGVDSIQNDLLLRERRSVRSPGAPSLN
jgi:hypothetical protein